MNMEDEIGAARSAVDAWHLGKTSSKYESGDRGPGAISTGQDDHGGASYGTYQLSRNVGTLQEYLRNSQYGRRFDGLSIASPQFNAKWRDLASSDDNFGRDQHEFIKRTHYDVQHQRLKASGLDLTNRGRAVNDALWSTSVQFGSKTRDIFLLGIEEAFGRGVDISALSDMDIVEAVQSYKTNHNSALFKSSPRAWASLLRRAGDEKADLMQLAAHEQLLAQRNLFPDWKQSVLPPSNIAHAQTDEERIIGNIQQNLAQLGIADAHGRALIPDGHYGPATRHAIETFQRQHSLPVNGLANEEILMATKVAASMAQPKPPALDHDTVKALQRNLARLGTTDHQGHTLHDDGLYGERTRGAVAAFQQQHGLPVTGVADLATVSIVQALVTADDVQQQNPVRQAVPPTTPSNLDADTIRTLQTHLNTLGVTDMNQQAVAVNGVYDLSTHTAVARFQAEQGMPVTGHVDDATRTLLQSHAFIADLQRIPIPHLSLNTSAQITSRANLGDAWRKPETAAIAPTATQPNPGHTPQASPVQAQAHRQPQAAPIRNDPRSPDHPDHALYTALQRRIPDASDDRLVQFTAACRKVKINADNLGDILLNENDLTITFVAKGSFGPFTDVDLKQAPPTPEQSMQHVQAHEQDQSQKWTQFHERQREISAQAQHGLVLGGPPLLH